jgi:MtN3 and saliva related transmembrane protein
MYSIENIFGMIAFITSLIGLLPQIYKSYQTKSTQDVSMILLINWWICSSAWIIHGTCQGAMFVVWSNVFGLLTASIAIGQKYYYDRKNVPA